MELKNTNRLYIYEITNTKTGQRMIPGYIHTDELAVRWLQRIANSTQDINPEEFIMEKVGEWYAEQEYDKEGKKLPRVINYEEPKRKWTGKYQKELKNELKELIKEQIKETLKTLAEEKESNITDINEN